MSTRKNVTRFIFGTLLLAFALTFSAFSFSTSAHAAVALQSTPASSQHATMALSCPGSISEGSQGTSVKALQTALNSLYLNYSDSRWFANSPNNFQPYSQDLSHPLRVDGDFGSHTFNAVWDYQYWNGLSIDGQVGPQTWHSLGYC